MKSIWSPWLKVLQFNESASPWNTDTVIREELLSDERLELFAAALAESQLVSHAPQLRRSLHTRLTENEVALLAAYRTIASAVDSGQPITPAAEWLIDNYHLIEQQTRQIEDDLPPRFYKQLPKLSAGPLAGFPRVFGITWSYVAHTDSHFDPNSLRRFVRAYQQVQPLTIGELWAIAITLRIVLVENLRRAAERIVGSRTVRVEADDVADRLLGVNGYDADPEALVRHKVRDEPFSAVFVVQIVKRLRDQDPRITPALQWLENQLIEQGTTSDQMVHEDQLRQGASNVTVRNIITSMRLISDVNWPDFLEDVSLVDAALRAGAKSNTDFSSMDFATRNLYRSAVEDLARGSAHSEVAIAQMVADIVRNKARQYEERPAPKELNPREINPSEINPREIDPREIDPRELDPGYYLLAGGRLQFERSIGFKPMARQRLMRVATWLEPLGYLSAIGSVTVMALLAPLLLLRSHGSTPLPLFLLALAGLIPAIDLAVAVVNRLITQGIGATLLPGLALREGVPVELKTMVVVPMLLTTTESIEEQIDRLEVHYLASSHGAIHFALLADFTDASSEHVDGDGMLLATASKGIARLNRLHGPCADNKRFYLFHRRRLWNERQATWMGWERKRGKLHELNRLLRGATDTTFVDTKGNTPIAPQGVRYVVTLDADTRLPRETVRRLVGKLAHPLNHPRFDAANRRVIEGYGILQPRVTPSLPLGREGSLFQRIFSSGNGIDPYNSAVSDVYQDLFEEGSYAGKGIYDIDAFETSLNGRAPDNTLLSHDLFEGTFSRAGLASDI